MTNIISSVGAKEEQKASDWDTKLFSSFERLIAQEKESIKTSPSTKVLSTTYVAMIKFLKVMNKKIKTKP